MIIGVDIDGVISVAPLGLKGLNWIPRIFKNFWNRFADSPMGRFVYLYLRTTNKEARDSLLKLKHQGHTIVIISYMFERHRAIVERWLRKQGIPFDELILASKNEKSFDFKKRAVTDQRCERFFDDELELVELLGDIAIFYPGKGPLVLH